MYVYVIRLIVCNRCFVCCLFLDSNIYEKSYPQEGRAGCHAHYKIYTLTDLYVFTLLYDYDDINVIAYTPTYTYTYTFNEETKNNKYLHMNIHGCMYLYFF